MADEQIVVVDIETGTVQVNVKGDSPLVLNRLSEKTRQELLNPSPKMTNNERATTLKHDPLFEYQSSATQLPDGDTLLALPATAFKGSLMTAALDIPGIKKTQIGRLTYVVEEYVPVFGIPKLFMTPVRMCDMNRTPDIRTRCIIPHWTARFHITFVKPFLTIETLFRLLGAAGTYVGVGDGRPEKGKLSFGRYSTTVPDNQDYQYIQASGSREIQVEAMKNPEFYNSESEELFNWFLEDLNNRQQAGRPKQKRREVEVG